ncbi:MAG: hypothetical protein HFP81_09580 [Methylococcales symbiont of Hymedesmia sp. n. MRB-2018]|nr:MAG: hypothetical protein HFP78_03730 [Methylococcales symbiont of Hymedesmia sp. n. MRB-2018]KAF3982958.1 MAG: hypothetical protein HFP81_09580 [Methylococcales symbiont of Hymedesmia sp. n. MRB-2018]
MKILKKLCFFVNILSAKIIPQKSKVLLHIFGKKLSNKPSKEKQSYLFYYGAWQKAGISHLTSNLSHSIRESIVLGRTLVITKPVLNPKHNNVIVINTSWHKYYDMQTTLQKAGGSYIDYEYFIKKQFAKDEVLLAGGRQNISKAQNQRYKVIIRKVQGVGLFRKDLYPVPPMTIEKYYSKIIVCEAQKVLEKLPQDYCAIHIRRGDFLQIYPKLKQQTSPLGILKILKKYNSKKLPVFLMTNEPDKEFYKNLASEFQIYYYYHFDNLSQLSQQKDNYQLFCVEKFIFQRAAIQIDKKLIMQEPH